MASNWVDVSCRLPFKIMIEKSLKICYIVAKHACVGNAGSRLLIFGPTSRVRLCLCDILYQCFRMNSVFQYWSTPGIGYRVKIDESSRAGPVHTRPFLSSCRPWPGIRCFYFIFFFLLNYCCIGKWTWSVSHVRDTRVPDCQYAAMKPPFPISMLDFLLRAFYNIH